MKTIIKAIQFFCLLLLASPAATAQSNAYFFSRTTAPYVPLTQGQKISPPGFPATTYQLPVSLPFSFSVMGTKYNVCVIVGGGSIIFPNTSVPIFRFIGVLGGNLKLKDSTSGVYTQTDGTTGSRVHKIEFRNMGFTTTASSDFVNFQAWLYEGTNDIELRYGPRSNFSPLGYGNQRGPFIGVIEEINGSSSSNTSYYLVGDSAAPIFKIDKPALYDTFLKGNVPENTVYAFTTTQKNVSVPEKPANALHDFEVYPNPTNGGDITVNITGNSTTLKVTDMSGKILITKTSEPGATLMTMETSQLSPGIYLLWVNGPEGRANCRKIIVD